MYCSKSEVPMFLVSLPCQFAEIIHANDCRGQRVMVWLIHFLQITEIQFSEPGNKAADPKLERLPQVPPSA